MLAHGVNGVEAIKKLKLKLNKNEHQEFAGMLTYAQARLEPLQLIPSKFIPYFFLQWS